MEIRLYRTIEEIRKMALLVGMDVATSFGKDNTCFMGLDMKTEEVVLVVREKSRIDSAVKKFATFLFKENITNFVFVFEKNSIGNQVYEILTNASESIMIEHGGRVTELFDIFASKHVFIETTETKKQIYFDFIYAYVAEGGTKKLKDKDLIGELNALEIDQNTNKVISTGKKDMVMAFGIALTHMKTISLRKTILNKFEDIGDIFNDALDTPEAKAVQQDKEKNYDMILGELRGKSQELFGDNGMFKSPDHYMANVMNNGRPSNYSRKDEVIDELFGDIENQQTDIHGKDNDPWSLIE
jgi:hypothetical protein